MVSRWNRHGATWTWVVGIAPLAFANIVGVLILIVAYGLWALGRSAPGIDAAWRSHVATWLGRAALVVIAVTSGAGPMRDSFDILG